MQEDNRTNPRPKPRTRSRKQKGKRKKRSLGPVFALFAIILLIGGVATAGFYGFNRWKTETEKPVVTEKPRNVVKETFPVSEPEASVSSTFEVTGSTPQEKAGQLLSQMKLEEKVAQLFVVTPEQLTGVTKVIAAGNASRLAYEQYPVGGLVYFKENLVSTNQVRDMLFNMKRYSSARMSVPAFLSVDEEGGSVARIGSTPEFGVTKIEDMAAIGASGDIGKAYEAGKTIGMYLSQLGFNLDYAPVADVWSNPENTVVAKRSFGTDGNAVAGYSKEVMRGLNEQGIIAVLKHFPGHGATAGDTHEGYSYTEKTQEELMGNDWIPFTSGIQAGADVVMVAHIAVPAITGNETPSSLSPKVVKDILRGQLGFKKLVITDALNMGAVTQQYTSSEAAVKALQAGVDLLLMPENFKEAYQGVLDAVAAGTVTEDRINESVLRILEVKFRKLV